MSVDVPDTEYGRRFAPGDYPTQGGDDEKFAVGRHLPEHSVWHRGSSPAFSATPSLDPRGTDEEAPHFVGCATLNRSRAAVPMLREPHHQQPALGLVGDPTIELIDLIPARLTGYEASDQLEVGLFPGAIGGDPTRAACKREAYPHRSSRTWQSRARAEARPAT
jgi:hypothetical protein